MHLKETVPECFGMYHSVRGMDFDYAIAAAWNLGVRMFVTEFWYKGEPEWQAGLHRTNEMFRKNSI